jgi:hypothetical protein
VNRSLGTYLSSALGRSVQREEIAVALGASISTVTRRQRDGFLADEVIAAARYFELSPIVALVDLGYLTSAELEAVAQLRTDSLETYSDVDLAEEMLRRVSVGAAGDPLTGPLGGAGERRGRRES